MDLKTISEDLQSLQSKIDQLLSLSPEIEHPYQSEHTNELYTALSKAQGEYPLIRCNRENPYFKLNYSDLDGILGPIRPILAKYELAFIQQEKCRPDGTKILHTKLTHSSGQWIEARHRVVPPKNDLQTYGSTLAYIKRFAGQTLLGVTISDDVIDDDAEVAMVNSRQVYAKGTALNAKYDPRNQSSEVITKEQLEELEYELSDNEDIAQMVLDTLRLQSLADMPKDKFRVSCRRIREIKATREGEK